MALIIVQFKSVMMWHVIEWITQGNHEKETLNPTKNFRLCNFVAFCNMAFS